MTTVRLALLDAPAFVLAMSVSAGVGKRKVPHVPDVGPSMKAVAK